MGSLFNRRVGPLGALIIVAVGIAVTIGIAQLLPKQDEAEKTATATATATAAPTACKRSTRPTARRRRTSAYDAVDESRRAETVKALKLDEAEGKVDVLAAKQTSSDLSLGELVGVPEPGPGEVRVLARSRASRAAARRSRRGNGYAILPLESGKQVAVGVKGCRTVLITAQDPDAVKFLAADDLQRCQRRAATHASSSPHHPNSQSIRASVPSGISSAGTSHSSTSIVVGSGSVAPRLAHAVGEAVVGEEDDVRVGRALQRGERAAGPRRAEVPHRLRRARPRAWWPRCRSRSIARLPPLGGDVAALGEDQHGVVGAEAAAHRLDLDARCRRRAGPRSGSAAAGRSGRSAGPARAPGA